MNQEAQVTAINCKEKLDGIRLIREGNPLVGLSEAQKADKDVVLEAIGDHQDEKTMGNWQQFKHAAKDLKKDLEFVLLVVARNGIAFQFIAEELKNNRKVQLTAFGSAPMSSARFPNKDEFNKEVSDWHDVSTDFIESSKVPANCSENDKPHRLFADAKLEEIRKSEAQPSGHVAQPAIKMVRSTDRSH